MKLLSAYQAIEIISGVLRPLRSASQLAATAPTSRIHKVMVSMNATAVSGTSNSCAIGLMISRNTVNSKEASVHPNQTAHQAHHYSRVGSRHHATGFSPSAQSSSRFSCRSQRLLRERLAFSVTQACNISYKFSAGGAAAGTPPLLEARRFAKHRGRTNPEGEHVAAGAAGKAIRVAQNAVEDARGPSLRYALALGACPIAFSVGDLAAAEQYVSTVVDQSARALLAVIG